MWWCSGYYFIILSLYQRGAYKTGSHWYVDSVLLPKSTELYPKWSQLMWHTMAPPDSDPWPLTVTTTWPFLDQITRRNPRRDPTDVWSTVSSGRRVQRQGPRRDGLVVGLLACRWTGLVPSDVTSTLYFNAVSKSLFTCDKVVMAFDFFACWKKTINLRCRKQNV